MKHIEVILLGAGKVGGAFLDALQTLPPGRVRLAGIANSRVCDFNPEGIAPAAARERLSRARTPSEPALFGDWLRRYGRGIPVIVDATASECVAAWHARWLESGIHVVTANKQAAASGWIADVQRRRAFYGDAATVGAGLPVLSSLRRLRAAGDRIERVEGIFSGSLGFLFHSLHAGQAFSAALEDAADAGYTEPDPRTDLSGEDVHRKLCIVAEAAGFPARITAAAPVLPDTYMNMTQEEFRLRLCELDDPLRAAVLDAQTRDCVLRYTGMVCADGTGRIGISAVERGTALAQSHGAENVVVVHSEAYRREPLVIRGPGAGPLVTARALLGDIAALLDRGTVLSGRRVHADAAYRHAI